MADQTKVITVEMMERLEAESGRFYELIDGELRVKEMASPKHANIASKLNMFVGSFIFQNQLGESYDSSASYLLKGTPEKPELVYLPDFSFVAADRVQQIYRGFYQLAPDLAVEIISPSERQGEIEKKTQDYLQCGVKQVWRIYPEQKQITVHFPDSTPTTYHEGDTLSSGDLLPGFTLAVSSLF